MVFGKRQYSFAITVAIVMVCLLATSVQATRAFQSANNGSICVLVFEDDNHSGARQSGDALLSDANVSLMVNDKVIIANHVTDGKEPFCFSDLPSQQYTLSFSSPLYQPTTLTSYTFALGPGERASREFGAAPIAATESAAVGSAPSGIASLATTTRGRVGISAAGALLVMILVGGLGLILFGLFVHRR